MRNSKMKILLIFLIILIVSTINAREIDWVQGPQEDNTDKNLLTRESDYQTYIDANNILMFVTNVGIIGGDISNMFGKADAYAGR